MILKNGIQNVFNNILNNMQLSCNNKSIADIDSEFNFDENENNDVKSKNKETNTSYTSLISRKAVKALTAVGTGYTLYNYAKKEDKDINDILIQLDKSDISDKLNTTTSTCDNGKSEDDSFNDLFNKNFDNGNNFNDLFNTNFDNGDNYDNKETDLDKTIIKKKIKKTSSEKLDKTLEKSFLEPLDSLDDTIKPSYDAKKNNNLDKTFTKILTNKDDSILNEYNSLIQNCQKIFNSNYMKINTVNEYIHYIKVRSNKLSPEILQDFNQKRIKIESDINQLYNDNKKYLSEAKSLMQNKNINIYEKIDQLNELNNNLNELSKLISDQSNNVNNLNNNIHDIIQKQDSQIITTNQNEFNQLINPQEIDETEKNKIDELSFIKDMKCALKNIQNMKDNFSQINVKRFYDTINGDNLRIMQSFNTIKTIIKYTMDIVYKLCSDKEQSAFIYHDIQKNFNSVINDIFYSTNRKYNSWTYGSLSSDISFKCSDFFDKNKNNNKLGGHDDIIYHIESTENLQNLSEYILQINPINKKDK